MAVASLWGHAHTHHWCCLAATHCTGGYSACMAEATAATVVHSPVHTISLDPEDNAAHRRCAPGHHRHCGMCAALAGRDSANGGGWQCIQYGQGRKRREEKGEGRVGGLMPKGWVWVPRQRMVDDPLNALQ